MENDSTVAEAWKEYVFTVREQVSPLLRPIQPHSTKGNLCEEHLDIWQMHAKNWCKFKTNLRGFRSASTLCDSASRTRLLASLVTNVQHLPPCLKRNSSRGLTVVRSPDLASRCNLSHMGRSGTYGKRKQGTCVIDGPLDRKSTRLNSSHANISYAVFCL